MSESFSLQAQRELAAESRSVRSSLYKALILANFQIIRDGTSSIEAERGSQISGWTSPEYLPLRVRVRLSNITAAADLAESTFPDTNAAPSADIIDSSDHNGAPAPDNSSTEKNTGKSSHTKTPTNSPATNTRTDSAVTNSAPATIEICRINIDLIDNLRSPVTYGLTARYALVFANVLGILDTALNQNIEPPQTFAPGTFRAPDIPVSSLAACTAPLPKSGIITQTDRLLRGKSRLPQTVVSLNGIHIIIFEFPTKTLAIGAGEIPGMLAAATHVLRQNTKMPEALLDDIERVATAIETSLPNQPHHTNVPGQFGRYSLSLRKEDYPVIVFLRQQAYVRSRLPLRQLLTCQDCHFTKVVNEDYRQISTRNRRLGGLVGGVGTTIGLGGLRPFLLAGQLFRMKKLDPDFVCPRCQGMTALVTAVTFCPKCGKRHEDGALITCTCGHDFRQGAVAALSELEIDAADLAHPPIVQPSNLSPTGAGPIPKPNATSTNTPLSNTPASNAFRANTPNMSVPKPSIAAPGSPGGAGSPSSVASSFAPNTAHTSAPNTGIKPPLSVSSPLPGPARTPDATPAVRRWGLIIPQSLSLAADPNPLPVPGILIIGTAREADLHLPDPTIAPFHCRVDPAPGGVWVAPLGGPTWVGNIRLSRPYLAPDGATITLGRITLRVVALLR